MSDKSHLSFFSCPTLFKQLSKPGKSKYSLPGANTEAEATQSSAMHKDMYSPALAHDKKAKLPSLYFIQGISDLFFTLLYKQCDYF